MVITFIRRIRFIKVIPAITVFGVFLAPFAQAAVMSSSSYKIQIDSVNVGGARGTSASYVVEQTSGESGTGRLTGNSNNFWAGFQLPVVASSPSPTSASPGASSAQSRRAQGSLQNIENFTATPREGSVQLRWINPADIDFLGVRIVRSETFYSTDPNEGLHVYAGRGQEFLDAGLSGAQAYYYTAFVYDRFGNFSSGAVAFAVPFDSAQGVPPVYPERSEGVEGPEPTPLPEVPLVPPDLVPEGLRFLSLQDFDFTQSGRNLPVTNGQIEVETSAPFTIAIGYDKLPEVLKTILVTMENSEGEAFSFLLRVDEEKRWYRATLKPPVAGLYKVNFFVVDHKNQGLQKVSGELEVKEAAIGFAAPPPKDGFGRFLPEFLIFSLAAFSVLAVRLFLRRHIGSHQKKLARDIGCLLLAFFLLNVPFGYVAQAAFNTQINYQGKLTDTSDNAVADGDYNFKFQLCTDSACASSVWSETRETTNKVTVTSGIFSVLLGSVTSIASVDFNDELWLEVQVGGTGSSPSYETLTPRKKLGAVAAAFEADKLDGLDSTAFLLVASNLSDLAATSTAIGNLGLTIGTDVQAYDDELRDIASTTPTKGDLIVSDGTDWLDFAVGSDGFVLTASSSASNGVSWEAGSSATALDEVGDPTASSTIEVGSTILTIDSSAASSTLVLDGNLGGIGIRTLSPSSTLDVTGSVRATDSFNFSDGSTQPYAATPNGFMWNVTTAVLKQTFSISGQETTPKGIFFRHDGKKMYVTGESGVDVNEYDLSTAWDVSTASFLQLFSVSTQEGAPNDVFFKPDGKKMYVLGDAGDDVNEYDLSTAWDVSTASFLQAFSVTNEETLPKAFFFKPDGTKMYVLGNSGDDVNEYDLSTPWDVSTGSAVDTFSISAQEANPEALFFKPDGTKMYVMGQDGDDVNEYNLATPWDASTGAFVQTFSVAGDDTLPTGLFFKPDGTKMYVLGDTGNDVNEYDLGLVLEGAAQLNGPLALGSQITMTANAATSSILAGSHFVTANTASTTVSNFTDGLTGQIIIVETGDANTTYDCTSNANFNCGTTDIVAETGNILAWMYDGSAWNLINWMNTKAAQSGADIAEWFPSTQKLKAGDLVAIDTSVPVSVKKTTDSYDKRMIGIISTQPGITLGEQATGTYAVALAGRVPTNVSLEGGAIAVGDAITSSGKEGVGMKAIGMGRTIGYALEPYDGSQENAQILVFIDPSWSPGSFDLNGLLAGVSASSTASSTPSSTQAGLAGQLLAAVRSALESFTGTVKTAGNWVFERITAKVVRVERIEMEDQKTGQAYCMWLENGEWVKARGDCTNAQEPITNNQTSSNNQNSNPPPEPEPEPDTASSTPRAQEEPVEGNNQEPNTGAEESEEGREEPVEEEVQEEEVAEGPVEEGLSLESEPEAETPAEPEDQAATPEPEPEPPADSAPAEEE